MPYSDNSNLADVERILRETRPKSVLDVGAGAGKYGSLVRKVLPDSTVDAVEVWEPYIGEFGLDGIYDYIWTRDVRDLLDPGYQPLVWDVYDLTIFGDILEHMTKEDAVAVFSAVRYAAIISIPIIHYPQGHSHGNPYEEHIKDDWSVEEVLDTFPVELVAQSESTAVFYKDRGRTYEDARFI